MRLREVVALLAGLAVVGGLGWFGYDWFLATTDPDAADEAAASPAQEVLDTFVDAWEAGDLAAMEATLASVPEDFTTVHEQLEEALEPTAVRIDAGELREPVDGRAELPVTVEVTPAQAPRSISWDTEVVATRNRGVWTVDWSLTTLHPELRPGWVFAVEVEDVPRRPILAADGTALASDDGRWLGFVPGGMEDPDDVAAAFERALPGTGVLAERELGRGELVDDWFYPVVTVSAARADAAWTVLRRTSGVVEPRVPTEEDQRRVLLDLGFAQHVVGIVAEATAEQLEELEEQGVEAEIGTRIPQFGLEAAFDEQLVGSEIHRVGLAERPEGPVTVTIDEAQDEPSAPVETTIDIAVQRAIENALAEMEDPAAIVAVDVEDGAIRGTASRPLSGYDRARTGRFAPGSTFKTVTLEAALAAGYDLDDTVPCPARTVVGGLEVTNLDDRDLGEVPLAEAFATSCNTTFALLAEEVGAPAMEAAAERFGFGVDPAHPLAAFGGSFPTPDDAAELAAASFGQARVEASPLHLAALAAAVPDGVWRQPYLLQEDGPGTTSSLSTGTADRLRAAMELVVTDGTGTAAAVDGASVAGKTGTAEVAGDAAANAWFIGTVGGLGFAVLVEGGGAGGDVAAPLAAAFVEQLLRFRDGDADPADPLQASPQPDQVDPDAEVETDDAEDGADAEAAEDGADAEAAEDGGTPEVQPEDG